MAPERPNSPDAPDLAEGQTEVVTAGPIVIEGSELIALAGAGGMGEVYLSRAW